MADPSSVMYSGATRRFMALVIDGLILGLVLAVITLVLRGMTHSIMVQQTISQLLAALYYILMESSGRMGSLGKSAMKIYVAMDEGKRAPVTTIVLRYLIFMLPSLPMVFVNYSSDYQNLIQTTQQYVDAHDLQGMANYLQGADSRAIIGHFRNMAAFSGALALGLIWLPIVFTKQKTGLHDHLTKTRVFKRAE